ncbi:RHS repeat-associated core domain-containing protein, partial [Kibdelosporangium lantanae]
RGFMAGQQLTAGLVQMGHREYDPAIGRFVSADPLLDARNPQQMNGYAYADNDPVTTTDKNGLFPARLLNDEHTAQQLWWDRADFQKKKQMPARMRNNEKMQKEITWDRGQAARDEALAYLQAFDDVMNNPAIRKLLGIQWDMARRWEFTGDTATCRGASYGEGLAMGASFCTNDQDGRKYTSDRNGIGVGFSLTTKQTVYSYVRKGHEGEKGSLYAIYISFKLGVGPATVSFTVSTDLDGNHMSIAGSEGLRLNQITPEKFAQALSDPVALLKPNANAEVGLSVKIPEGSSPCQVPAALKYGGCNPR